MPLAAYFCNVGAILFVLLMFADSFFPPQSPLEQRAAADRPVIRILSTAKPLERVIIDTTWVPTTVPDRGDSKIKVMAVAAVPKPPIAPVEASSRGREAIALLAQPTIPPKSIDQHRRQRKAPRHAARPSNYETSPAILSMRQRQFASGFFQWR